jgi:deazaflavin-dependent oxidoreductase (nitroreductase family)
MFLRAPIALYRARLGFLMGRRLLLLHHRGRKTGLLRRTVLEVVRHDERNGTYYVAAGFGVRSNWYQNLLAYPDARIEVGLRSFDVRAREIGVTEAADLMADYARRHPVAARTLARFMGFAVDGTEADYRALPALGLHFVALEPRPS